MPASWLIQSLAVAAGGAIGAVARFWISGWVQRLSGGQFPWGTLTVNIAGSFLLGFLSVYLFDHANLPAWIKLTLGAGLLGAFTTFSTFSLQTVELLVQGQILKAGLNIGLSVVCCLIAVAAGFGLARWLS